MSRDNRDRYGYQHRQDSDYEIGESMPGDVGDSKGTFHDRAHRDSNVIVDGEVRSMESHKRSSTNSKKKKTKGKSKSPRKSSKSTDSISQSEAVGKVVELTIESKGGTRDTMARYKNHQVHVEGGKPGETINVELKKGAGYLIGERVVVRE